MLMVPGTGETNFDVANIRVSISDPSWTPPLYLPHVQVGSVVDQICFCAIGIEVCGMFGDISCPGKRPANVNISRESQLDSGACMAADYDYSSIPHAAFSGHCSAVGG